MGLLDSILGQVLGGAQQQPQAGAQGGLSGLGPLGAELAGLLSNNGASGGLGGLVEKFGQAGLGNVIGSWVGKGDNAPISGDQVHSALGSDVVSGIAGKMGITVTALLPMLATMLPTLINELTPHGQVPESGAPGAGNHADLLSSLSGLLQKQ